MTDFIITDKITCSAHGKQWDIEMKDDYSGYLVTNNAAESFEVSTIIQAIRVVNTNQSNHKIP